MASSLALKASSSRAGVVSRPARSSNVSRMFVKRAPLVRVQAEASSAAPTKVGDVDDDTFNQIVRGSDIPVLVDFWAPWCGPCRFIAPLIDEISEEYKGRLLVVKLDTDKSPKTATALGIRSIPTVMVFKNGEKQDLVIGAVPKATLIQTIEKYL